MQQLSSLEQQVANIHKDLPHFPKGLRDWLVENAWWLVAIAVALGALSLVAALPVLFAGTAVVSVYGGAIAGSQVFAAGVVNVVVLLMTMVVEAMAIQPLKAKQKRGWDLLFLASLVGLAGSLVGAAVVGNILGGLIGVVVGAAIGFYVLFELRGYYLEHGRTTSADKKDAK